MRGRAPRAFQTKFFYAGSIFAVNLGLVYLMWTFRTVNWILIAFGLAWMVVVTAFAWEVVTRTERLNETVQARTDALKETNRNLSELIERLNAFHGISYEINQRIELRQIAETFVNRIFKKLPEVEGAWLWLESSLLEEGPPPGPREPPRPLPLAAQCGLNFGNPRVLNPLRPDNPLAERCFDGRSVSLEHNMQQRARTWGWSWLVNPRVESFVAFPLQLGSSMLGILGVFCKHHISAEFVSQLQLSANQLTVALEKARLLKESRLRAEQLAEANEELRELDAMKDWFVSSVSHELRTPLTNIRSFAEILTNYDDLSTEEGREFASVICQETELLSELITDVLDMARIANGEVSLRPEWVDLRELVGKCCRPFSKEAEERNIDFGQSLPAELPPVYADPKAVGRILNNLIGNALKFTPEGGSVEVSAEPTHPGCEDGFLTVTVADTGIGIKLKDQARVFERFTQVGTGLSDKPPGTGIGLAICREIVEESGGEIWVQSAPQEGSTFGFTLPLSAPEPDPADA